jgi:hypothetical protein
MGVMKSFSNGGIAVVAALIFTCSFVFLAIAMNREVNVYDEALMLVGATRVADGAVLHRDFYANYGPAQFYVLAGIFKMFGASVLVERVWDTVVRAMMVTVAFLIVQRAASRREGLLAAGLVLVWACAFATYAFPVFPALLFALLGALCLLPVFEGHRSMPLLFGSGFCVGITVLFRYDVGFYAFAALTLVSAVYVLSRPTTRSARLTDLLRVLLPCWLGLAIVCVPVAAAYVVSGAFHDFLFDILTFPAHFYSRMRGLPFPGPSATLRSPIQIGIYLPIFVWLASFCALFFDRRSSRAAGAPAARPWIMLLLGLLSAFFYLKGLVRVSIIHVALSIVPALMLSAMLLPTIRRGAGLRLARPAMIAALAGLIIVAVPTLIVIAGDGRAALHTVRWAARSTTWTPATADMPAALGSCSPTFGLERVACFAIDQTRADAIRYVEARSRPNDAIFVGLRRHDRIFANDALFYFVAARRPATKWYHFDPGLQTSKEIQTAMIGDLTATRPRYVVLEANWEDSTEPNESAVSSGVTLLDDFIRANYQPIRAFGTIAVLQAKEG